MVIGEMHTLDRVLLTVFVDQSYLTTPGGRDVLDVFDRHVARGPPLTTIELVKSLRLVKLYKRNVDRGARVRSRAWETAMIVSLPSSRSGPIPQRTRGFNALFPARCSEL